ncbi:MAG: DUF4249 domain-containing protein [Tannerellaceae bacterium]
MKYIQTHTIAGVLLLLLSCTTDIEIRMKPTTPKLVLNASVGTGQELSAHLSRSWFITEQPVDEALDGATIRVFVNDQDKGRMQLVDDPADTTTPRGQYRLPGCRLQTGDHLLLQAEATDLAPVAAEMEMPERTDILSVDTLWMGDSSYMGNLQLYVRFKDRANEPNYYRLVVRKETDYWKADSLITTVAYGTSSEGASTNYLNHYYSGYNFTLFSYENFRVDYNDPVFLPQGGNNYPDKLESYSCWGCFADEQIDGQEYSLKSTMDYAAVSYKGDSVTSIVHYDVQLFSVTSSYYQYMKAMWRFALIGYGLEGLKEPLAAYTNIEGGYGVLSGYQISSRRFTMPFGSIPPAVTPFSKP